MGFGLAYVQVGGEFSVICSVCARKQINSCRPIDTEDAKEYGSEECEECGMPLTEE